MAIGLDGMKRATIVGTRMAGLNGGIFNLELPHTKISVSYAGERLNHINGTPRENFVPPVFVNLLDKRLSRVHDPIFEIGYQALRRLIAGQPNKSFQPTPRRLPFIHLEGRRKYCRFRRGAAGDWRR